MKYVRFGTTGLEVSRLCLGCMTFGEPARGTHPWTLDETASRPLLRRAIERGINFFDTANVYSDGSSEEILGRAIRDFARRDEVVIATKVSGRMRPGPNGAGLSRKAILHEIDESLRRLGTDYVDLYQIHRFDPSVPIEETLDALDAVVRAGKARHIGASSMFAWQFLDMLNMSARRGWSAFVSMQNHYNLLYREEEREMLPLCAAKGIAVMPWSPLARGRLARPWGEDTRRIAADDYGRTLYDAAHAADRAIIDCVNEAALAEGVPSAEVALAWLLGKGAHVTPIVGASTLEQLDMAIAALDLSLDPALAAALEAPYVPRPLAGHG